MFLLCFVKKKKKHRWHFYNTFFFCSCVTTEKLDGATCCTHRLLLHRNEFLYFNKSKLCAFGQRNFEHRWLIRFIGSSCTNIPQVMRELKDGYKLGYSGRQALQWENEPFLYSSSSMILGLQQSFYVTTSSITKEISGLTLMAK